MRRLGAILVLLSATVVAGVTAPRPALADGARRGVPIVGALGVRRTVEELQAGSRERQRPVSSLPVRRGRADKTTDQRSPAAAAPAPLAAQAVASGLSFDGPTLEASPNAAFPPDTQGDVGPTQFLVTLNSRFRTYDKATGTADGGVDETPDSFFADAMTPVVCNFASDPHVRYDRLSDRWFVLMIDVPDCDGGTSNRVMIAVSGGATLSGSTTWTFFHIDAPAGLFYDYPTLGIDHNALYIGVNGFLTTGQQGFSRSDGLVVPKTSILGAGPIVSTRFTLATGSGAGPFTPQGVDDPNDASTSGFFIGVDNASFGKLDLVRITDPGGTPAASSTIAVTVPPTTFPITVPHLGNTGGNNGRLDAIDDRLFAATMTADGHIWTAHDIQVNSAGIASGTGGRDGSRWYEIVPGSGSPPTLVQSGTVFDPATTNPRSYWMPTVAVSGQGIMAIGGSTAGALAHADTWYATRSAGDPLGSVSAPTISTSSTFGYNPAADPGGSGGRRWGDYSLTRVDPQDDQTLWTIQEYTQATDTWGVRIVRLDAPPPATPASTSRKVPTGMKSVLVTLTGTSTGGSGWFDPRPGYPKRLAVSVGCGVSVRAVGFTSPTSLDLDLDTRDAAAAKCLVTTTNPDGQASGASVLRTVRYRPDAKVKAGVSVPYVGNDVYNTTGKRQSASVKKPSGSKATFFVQTQNDGSVADRFRLSGPGSVAGFSVRYFSGSTNVTSKIVNGTFRTAALGPGKAATIRLVVTPTEAGAGTSRSWLVTATSTHQASRKDAVKTTVKVVAG